MISFRSANAEMARLS